MNVGFYLSYDIKIASNEKKSLSCYGHHFIHVTLPKLVAPYKKCSNGSGPLHI